MGLFAQVIQLFRQFVHFLNPNLISNTNYLQLTILKLHLIQVSYNVFDHRIINLHPQYHCTGQGLHS